MSAPTTLWDQRKDENGQWFARFELYRLAGPNRSYLGVYKQDLERRGKNPSKAKSIPNSWRDIIKKFDWDTRAQSWDEHQRKLKIKELAREAERMAEYRRTTVKAMQALFGKIVSVIGDGMEADGKDGKVMDPKAFKELAATMAIILKESRLEYGDPTEINQVNTTDDSSSRGAPDNRLSTLLATARARRNAQISGGDN